MSILIIESDETNWGEYRRVLDGRGWVFTDNAATGLRMLGMPRADYDAIIVEAACWDNDVWAKNEVQHTLDFLRQIKERRFWRPDQRKPTVIVIADDSSVDRRQFAPATCVLRGDFLLSPHRYLN